MSPHVTAETIPEPERWGGRRVTESAGPLTEEEATALAAQAVDQAGGAQMIYRNPRHPFSFHRAAVYDVGGHRAEVQWGEISSPAIVTVGGYVFEIGETGIELLIRPPRSQESGVRGQE